jgi:hypothetical protein
VSRAIATLAKASIDNWFAITTLAKASIDNWFAIATLAKASADNRLASTNQFDMIDHQQLSCTY